MAASGNSEGSYQTPCIALRKLWVQALPGPDEGAQGCPLLNKAIMTEAAVCVECLIPQCQHTVHMSTVVHRAMCRKDKKHPLTKSDGAEPSVGASAAAALLLRSLSVALMPLTASPMASCSSSML
jgi:hypothetical protein